MYADWHASVAKPRKPSRLTPKIVFFRKYNRCSHSSIHPYSSTYPYQGVRYELGWSKPICLLISLRGLEEYFFSLYGGHSRGCLWMLQFESILAYLSLFLLFSLKWLLDSQLSTENTAADAMANNERCISQVLWWVDAAFFPTSWRHDFQMLLICVRVFSRHSVVFPFSSFLNFL